MSGSQDTSAAPSLALARTALEKIHALRLSAMPSNYEIWYRVTIRGSHATTEFIATNFLISKGRGVFRVLFIARCVALYQHAP
jgi:hypothetical protein